MGADSLNTIRTSHAHYFAQAADDPFPELFEQEPFIEFTT